MAEIIKPENIRTLTGADGQTFKVAVTNDGYPLMIATQNQETGMWVWKNATPKIIGEIVNIPTGCFYGGSNNITWPEIQKVTDIVNNNFNYGGVWAGMTRSQPKEGFFNYEDIEFGMSQAQLGKDMGTIVHPIIWGSGEVPSWTKRKSKTELLSLIDKHVTTIVANIKTANKGSPPVINVVNEPMFRDSFWSIAGKEYITTALLAARKAYPEAKLIISSFDNETKNGSQYNSTLTLAKELYNQKLIDGVGIELVINGEKPPTKKMLIEGLQSYSMPIYITESAIKMGKFAGDNQARLAEQAKIERMLGEVASEVGVKLFVVFQATDDVSIYNDPTWEGGNPNNNTTLYDKNYEKKPAYYALIAGLLDGYKK
ncbi:MAG: endo-1,4-beta-xylanase [Parcubacteria group bacterium]|nr:endo-1,4-beta-xylanase [Parcubacteria group bacterium]